MSKQLIFSAVIGLPTGLLLTANRIATGSYWWGAMWAVLAVMHLHIIILEMRSARAKREVQTEPR